jgi:hypothetical protein
MEDIKFVNDVTFQCFYIHIRFIITKYVNIHRYGSSVIIVTRTRV